MSRSVQARKLLDLFERRLPLKRWSREAITTLNHHGYHSYLKTRWWDVTRTVALVEARNCCEFCGSTDRLHVHHLNYDNIGQELPEDLIVLCWSCHADAHEFPKRGEEIRAFANKRALNG